MTDNVENLVLEHLRALRAGQDRIENELRDMKSRLSAVEAGLNGVRRDLVALAEADARLQVTIDRPGRPHRAAAGTTRNQLGQAAESHNN